MSVDFIASWLNEHGLPIGFTLLGAFLAKHYGLIPIESFIRRTIKVRRSRSRSELEYKQRVATLTDIGKSVLNLTVWILTILLILLELNVNIQPLITGAGVVGIVLGFGAQNILKDIFAGIFVIVENQYQVGDVVDLDGNAGTVEDISLRMTVLRDLSGTVHHVPNGTINRALNLSKSYARVNLDVNVGYDTDIDKLAKLINQVGRELAGDPEWKFRIIAPPEFLRINDFTDSGMVAKIVGDTKPLEHWGVTGELRKRLKIAFDKAGIEIPYPQQVIREVKAKSKT